jgi:hypothetical protein
MSGDGGDLAAATLAPEDPGIGRGDASRVNVIEAAVGRSNEQISVLVRGHDTTQRQREVC